MAENDESIEKERIQDELDVEFGEEEEEDVILKLRMTIYDFVVRNGRRILYTIGAFLILVLIYGLFEGYLRDVQRSGHEAVFTATMNAPKISDRAMQGFAPLDNPNDLNRMQKLRAIATELEKVAQGNSGFAKSTAFLEAASYWSRSGEHSSEQAALKLALESAESELVKWAATSRLAYSYTASDQLELASKTFTDFAQNKTDFYGEAAILSAVEIELQRENVKTAGELLEMYQTQISSPKLGTRALELRLEVGLPELETEAPAEGTSE
ncbi:MAG: hypothetical protein ACON4U_07625 [Myxococcota bacterium]